MMVRAYEGKEPRLGARVFVAENAVLIGDVEIGDDSSIWFGTVLRGDVHRIAGDEEVARVALARRDHFAGIHADA